MYIRNLSKNEGIGDALYGLWLKKEGAHKKRSLRKLTNKRNAI
jgi:hypothetical protein